MKNGNPTNPAITIVPSPQGASPEQDLRLWGEMGPQAGALRAYESALQRRAVELDQDREALRLERLALSEERAQLRREAAQERQQLREAGEQAAKNLINQATTTAAAIVAQAEETRQQAREQWQQAKDQQTRAAEHLRESTATAAAISTQAAAQAEATARQASAQLRLADEATQHSLNQLVRSREMGAVLAEGAPQRKSTAEAVSDVFSTLFGLAHGLFETVLTANPAKTGELVDAVSGVVRGMGGASAAPPASAPAPAPAAVEAEILPHASTAQGGAETGKGKHEEIVSTNSADASLSLGELSLLFTHQARAEAITIELAAARGIELAQVPVCDVLALLKHEATQETKSEAP